MRELTLGRFTTPNHKHKNWFVTAESGTAIEDVLQPGYWAFVAVQLNPYDRITVATDDDTWIAELIVRQVAKTAAIVFELSRHVFTDMDGSQMQASNLYVKWKGIHWRWCVMRHGETEPLKKDFVSRDEAVAHMATVDGVRIS